MFRRADAERRSSAGNKSAQRDAPPRPGHPLCRAPQGLLWQPTDMGPRGFLGSPGVLLAFLGSPEVLSAWPKRGRRWQGLSDLRGTCCQCQHCPQAGCGGSRLKAQGLASWKTCITSLTAEAAGAFLLLFAEFRDILLLKEAQTIQSESRRLGGDAEFSEPPG